MLTSWATEVRVRGRVRSRAGTHEENMFILLLSLRVFVLSYVFICCIFCFAVFSSLPLRRFLNNGVVAMRSFVLCAKSANLCVIFSSLLFLLLCRVFFYKDIDVLFLLPFL